LEQALAWYFSSIPFHEIINKMLRILPCLRLFSHILTRNKVSFRYQFGRTCSTSSFEEDDTSLVYDVVISGGGMVGASMACALG
jgi:hypothetical protein